MRFDIFRQFVRVPRIYGQFMAMLKCLLAEQESRWTCTSKHNDLFRGHNAVETLNSLRLILDLKILLNI